MILSDLEHLSGQVKMTPNFQKGIDYLRQIAQNPPADGRFEVDGDRVYAMATTFTGKTGSEPLFEGHRKYIDIQYVASGREKIGWAPLAAANESNMTYSSEKDAWLGTAPEEATTWLVLNPGQLAVFFPEDAHAPMQAAGEPVTIKKLVVKVAID